jgi:alpha-amylase
MHRIDFVFGLHVHQPVGNFDHVFADHVEHVYLPFLTKLAEREFLPCALHVSGPLLAWLEAHDTRYLDLIGRLVADGKLEVLLSGFYEPILASIPRADRIDQIAWMRDAVTRRFGAHDDTLWLTERVWEPELAADLVDAGIRSVLVDDRHFLVSGFTPDQLHGPFVTESDGKGLAVLPIDERLRYLVPFRPPAETASYLRSLAEREFRVAVLADDGEKFGGWPGTKEWVYDRGWLDSFLDTMGRMIEDGEIALSTPGRVCRDVPSVGLAYLPSASYREMEIWALPGGAAHRLQDLEAHLGEERVRTVEGLLRGAHWRNFLVKYPESNRMHKKMLRLSTLCRARGEPADARRAIGQAQCNDAYWHGVFGGLYLPHLRAEIWRHLARAERILRRDESLTAETVDFDWDGHEEIWVHSDRFSAVVSPRRGGAVEEFTLFGGEINLADVLTRRREPYHRVEPEHHVDAGDRGTPSIHDIEGTIALTEVPPVDHHPRSLLDERVIGHDLDPGLYARADYVPISTWAHIAMTAEITSSDDEIRVRLTPIASHRLHSKELVFDGSGNLTVRYEWEPTAFPGGAWFAPEISLSREVPIRCEPETTSWTSDIATVAKSERGLEETRQGISVTPRWPIALGRATVHLQTGTEP